MTYTHQLGELVADLRYEDIPETVLEKLKTCLLYTLCMAAANPRISKGLASGRAVYNAPGVSTPFMETEKRRLAPPDAAWLNAYLSCSRGQNDTFSDLYAHGGCIVIPAILAMAQAQASTGREVLTAMAAGYETLGLIASNVSGETVKRGFRATSVYGVLACAAAIAKLLDLQSDQAACAIGLATQSAAGTMQCWEEGTSEWRVQVANATRDGIMAAQLAAAGHDCAAYALEGKKGFYSAFAGSAPVLANSWLCKTPEVVFKPMPGCLINQGPLYLLISLMRENSFDEQNVAQITVSLSPTNATYPGIANYGPFKASPGAIMSGPFMLALGLRQMKLRTNDFDAFYGPGDIHDLAQRIKIQADTELSGWACILRVTLDDDTVLETAMTDMSGFQFGWDESVSLLSLTLDEWPVADSAERFAQLQSLIRHLENEENIDKLVDLMEGSL